MKIKIINPKSTEIFKLKFNFSGEAQQKQVNDITNENMNISNPSNPPESRQGEELNLQLENECNTMIEESDNNAEEGIFDNKNKSLEKKDNDKKDDIPKPILKLSKLIFDIKDAKEKGRIADMLGFLG